MKFGVSFPNSAPYCELKFVTSFVCEAEKLGYDSFLVPDHYMWEWGDETWDVWTLLAYLAARTSRIRLGTCVTPIPLRPPSIVAKQAATVDVLSGGRLIFGVGVGWNKMEFEAYSTWDQPNIRVRKTVEGLSLILNMWQQKRTDHHGKYFVAKDAGLEPKPVQKPHPPVWMGSQGAGDYLLKLSARMCDGWIPLAWKVPAEHYRASVKKLQAFRAQYGREGEFVKATMAGIIIPDNLELPQNYVDPTSGYPISRYMSTGGPLSNQTKIIEEYRNAGCEYYVPLAFYPPKSALDQLRSFADKIVQCFI